MASIFYTQGVGNEQVAHAASDNKLKVYQTLSQLKSDIANLREGQIVATIEDEYDESTFDEFSERLDNFEKDLSDLQATLGTTGDELDDLKTQFDELKADYESNKETVSDKLEEIEQSIDDLTAKFDDYYTKEETDEELAKKQDKIQIVDSKDDLELEDGELGIAKEDGLFYQDGDELLNVSGKGTGDGIAFTGTAEELEEALKIEEGSDGYIPANALVLVLDQDDEIGDFQ